MSVAIRRALYGALAGDTTLNNLLGTPAPGHTKNLYHQQAPDGARYPFVIFSKSSGTPTYTYKVGHAIADNELWLIKGVDHPEKGEADADSVDAVASRLDALLTDGTISISGAEQLYLRRESDVEYAENDEGEVYLHSGALFRLFYSTT